MVNTGQRIESRADQERRHAGRDKTKAYLVGGGIASLASAAASLTTGATRPAPMEAR